jgi:hypothetical protein
MTTNFSRGISTWRFLRLCWRAPVILIVCAGILPRDVEPISQAQLLLFSSDIALAIAQEPIRWACVKAAVARGRAGTNALTRAPRGWQPFASRRESCVKSCDYQLLGGSSSVAGRATKQSAPNMLNPQIAIQKNVSWVKRKLGDSPDETAFFHWPLQRLLERTGFRDVRIDPFDFLHPKTPRPSQSF